MINEKSPYAQARHIFYGFELNESGIFAIEVRSALMTLISRNKDKPQKFITKKIGANIYISRIA